MYRPSRTRTIPALALVLALGVSHAPASAEELFVSPRGNDRWSGRLAEPNAASSDGPLATPEAARDALRALRKAGATGPLTVTIRGGTYALERPLLLDLRDSGSADAPVTWRAAPGERAVLSGGRRVQGFRATTLGGRSAWVTRLPETVAGVGTLRQLFVNGRRASRPRVPREGVLTIAGLPDDGASVPWNKGQSSFRFAPGDVASWRNITDVEVVALHFWVESRMRVASVDLAERLVRLATPSVFRLTDDFSTRGARYYVENVAEALDEPGEWYFDRPSGTLTYLPLAGEEPGSAVAVVPVLETILSLQGNPSDGTRIEGLRFEGLVFSHTATDAPSSMQAAVSVPAAIRLDWAADCAFERCELSALGTYGVELGYGCRDVRIAGCRMADLGAGGVKIGRGSRATIVEDNDIGDGGKIYRSAVGVWIGDSSANRVAHNRIHDLDYTGVSVGWVWGYGLSSAEDNVVEANHIHDVGRRVLSDLAGVYTLGVSRGTVVRGNLIHDCRSWSYGGWGLYTDEGSSFITMEKNVVYNTTTGGFHQHYGRENVIRNNVFAYAERHQIQRTRSEEHRSFTFERNIVLWREGELLDGNWADDNYAMDGNVFWDERWGSGARARSGAVSFSGATLRQWRRRGHDTKSLFVDPLFVDPARGDFSLRPGSPALRLGFVPIDLSGVGPRLRPGPP